MLLTFALTMHIVMSIVRSGFAHTYIVSSIFSVASNSQIKSLELRNLLRIFVQSDPGSEVGVVWHRP